MHPLQRIEDAVVALGARLRPVDTLPDVLDQLVTVNETLAAIHTELSGLRQDLASFQALQLGTAARASTARKPTARGR